MPTITLSAGNVSYVESGSGRSLLLLHSLGTSKRLWADVISELASSHHVFAPDYLGHGDSDPPPREFTIPDHADVMAEFMERMGVTSYAVAGTSLGAIIGIDLASRYRDRIEALILNGCPGWHLESQRVGRLISVAERFVQQDGLPRPQAAPSGTVQPVTEEELQHRRADLEKAGRWFISSMWAIASYDLAARLPKIRCRTLVLMGEADFHLPTSYVLTDRIEGSQLRIIPNAGHLTPYDDPSRVAAEIHQFVSEADIVRVPQL